MHCIVVDNIFSDWKALNVLLAIPQGHPAFSYSRGKGRAIVKHYISKNKENCWTVSLMWMQLKSLVEFKKKRGGKKVLMDYLTGHIRSAWLLTGCYTACFSPMLLPSVSVWQLAHLIYLIGLVQSVGNVLKANQGDGGTSAGDIVSQVWK